MKFNFKNIYLSVASILLIVIVFFGGYFTANIKSFDSNISFTEIVNASGQADLTNFWKVWNLLDEKFISSATSSKISNEEKINGAISGLVDSLGDPYTVFFPPKEKKSFDDSLKGNLEGVGMEVGLKEGVISVIAPLKGSPAERAGIKPGDIVAEIDGETTLNMTVEVAVSKIRGKAGSTVALTIIRENEKEPLKINIVREIIKIPNLKTELREDGIFVISLYNFGNSASAEFRKALREFVLSKKSRLILDLRGNPGGYLESAVDIASWFLPSGKVIVQEDFGKEVKNFRANGQNVFNDKLKMVVLIDKGSASASEILAGALQEHKIAKLVGTKSYGKGSVQELIDIGDDTSLKVTIARWLTPTGKSISEGGLTPDYLVDRAPEKIELEDFQMSEAVRILKSM